MENLKGSLKPLGGESPGKFSMTLSLAAVSPLSRAGVVRKRTSASPASVYNSGRRRGVKPDVHRTVKRDVHWTVKSSSTLSCAQHINSTTQVHSEFRRPINLAAATPSGSTKLSMCNCHADMSSISSDSASHKLRTGAWTALQYEEWAIT